MVGWFSVYQAQTDAKLWRLDRRTFRRIMLHSAVQKTQRYGNFLKSVPLFRDLDQVLLLRMIDALQPVHYQEGDVIVRQGDVGEEFFVIEEVRAFCCVLFRCGRQRLWAGGGGD